MFTLSSHALLDIGKRIVDVCFDHHDQHKTKYSYSCIHDPGNHRHTEQLGLQLKMMFVCLFVYCMKILP